METKEAVRRFPGCLRRLALVLFTCLAAGGLLWIGRAAALGASPTLLSGLRSASLAQAEVISPTLYLPMLMNSYDLFLNGDYSSGMSYWITELAGFTITDTPHGTGLPLSSVEYEGNSRGLIGNPAATNGTIPVGMGSFYRSFTVRQPYLSVTYRIITSDIMQGRDNLYYDTFEVSVNQPAGTISDTQRSSAECVAKANPEGVVVVPAQGGLVFCGGFPGQPGEEGTRRDLGWRQVYLDLSAFQGQPVTVYFTLWSREYLPHFYSDQAYHNTWLYLDDILPVREAVSSGKFGQRIWNGWERIASPSTPASAPAR